MATASINLPKGFVLDEQYREQAATPGPSVQRGMPAGFVIEPPAETPSDRRSNEFLYGTDQPHDVPWKHDTLRANVDKWTGPDWKSSIPDKKDWYYGDKEKAANIARLDLSRRRTRQGLPKTLTPEQRAGLAKKGLTPIGEGPSTFLHHGITPEGEGYIRSGAKPIGAKENIMRGDVLTKLPFSPVKAAEMLDVFGSLKRLEAEDFSKYTEAGIEAEKGKLRDQRVVDEYFKALQEQSVRGKTFMADVGSGVADLPAWMVEFWVTGGLAKLASKGVAKAGLKFMGKYVKTQAGRHALANALRAGAATVITPTLRTLQQPHRVVEGAVDNMIQGDQPITAWLKAGVSQNIENWSEAMGGYITKGLRTSFATKDVMRAFDDIAKARYIAQGGTAEAFGKAIKAGGYDGLIGELGEEWLGGMSQALLGTETFGAEQTGDFLKDTQARLDAAIIALGKQTPSMAVTLAVPGAIKGGLDIAGRARQEPPAEPPPQPPPAQPVQPQAAEPPAEVVREGVEPTKAQRQHKAAVEQLWKKGKPVAERYREMYPDLVEKYEPVQPPTAKPEKAETTTVFHGSDKIIEGKIKPSKSGVVFVTENKAHVIDYGKNVTEFQIPTDRILKIEPDERGQFRDDKYKSLGDAEKQGFLAIERAGEILTRPEVLQPPTAKPEKAVKEWGDVKSQLIKEKPVGTYDESPTGGADILVEPLDKKSIIDEVRENEGDEAAQVVRDLLDKEINTIDTHANPDEIIVQIESSRDVPASAKNLEILETAGLLWEPEKGMTYVRIPRKAQPPTAKVAPTEAAKAFTADPTTATAAVGEAGFVGVPGRPGGKAEKPWLDIEKVKSPSKDIESFFGRTKRPPYSRKASKLIAAIKAGVRERFVTMTPHIKSVPETAIYRDMIRTIPEEVRQAGERAVRNIISVLDNDGTVQVLDTSGLDLLRRKVFVQDILHEAEISRSIAGNLKLEALEAENKRLDKLIDKVPSVKQAYESRQKLWKEVSQDLLKRGVLDEEAAANQHYVRHFVLDLADKNRPTGFKRKRLSAPYRAYSKRRKGSVRDISTDYLEVEVRALTQIYKDNAIEDVANKISKLANKRKFYTTEARKENIEKAGQPPSGLKGFAVDKWLKEQLGKEYMSPEKLAQKDDYVEWHYKRPNLFYRAHTLNEAQIAALVESSAEEVGGMLNIPKDMMREALVLGRRKGMIIPDWLAKQLDDLPANRRSNYVVRSFTKPFVQFWKRWILRVNPFRYNARNQLGDTERLVASGQEGAIKKIPEGVKFLITKKGEPYDLMKKHGVAGSSLWHEMNDVSTIKVFERFKDYSKPKTFRAATMKAFALPFRTASKIGTVEQNLTQFREDILRAAVFLHNLEKLEAGKKVRHWAGSIADIEAIAKIDKPRAAAKISRETLGDYGAFTPFESDVLRQGIIPFYSWMKINTTFWPKVLYHAAGAGTAKKAIIPLAAKVALNVPRWLVRVMWIYAAAYLWNHRDEEAEDKEKSLPFWLRAMPHINTDNYTLWGQTALSDFVEWFDMESLAAIKWRQDAGFLGQKDAALEAARIIAEAPVNKIYQAFNPFMKAPITAITGMETWPTVFEPHYVATPASRKSFERAVLNILGTDAKRFYQTSKGDRKLEDTLYAYFAGWWARPTDAETLIEDVKRTKEYTSLKRKSPTTGRKKGEAKSGKEERWQEAEIRGKALK